MATNGDFKEPKNDMNWRRRNEPARDKGGENAMMDFLFGGGGSPQGPNDNDSDDDSIKSGKPLPKQELKPKR